MDKSNLRSLPIFDLMRPHVEEMELYRTFNMGIGMVLVVPAQNVDTVLAQSDGYVIGQMKAGIKGVQIVE